MHNVAKKITQVLIDNVLSKGFIRSAIFANGLIALGLIPQFLIVPLILRGWGETAYSEYIIFLAALSLFSQVSGAMQNGYILRLMDDGKVSSNNLLSMVFLNCLLLFPSSLFIFSNHYFDVGLISIDLTLALTICISILFFYNSLKVILQVASSVVAPLVASLAQSFITFILIFGVLSFGYEDSFSLILIVLLVYAFTFILCAIWAWRVLVDVGVVGSLSFKASLSSIRFFIKFGSLSFIVSLISNLFNNGSKIYLGNSFDAAVLVDFNLSLTLCMVSGQFITPVLGLIFPHLATSSLSAAKCLTWILNAHRIFWIIAIFMYLAYLIFVDMLIVLWLGSEYLHLSELVLKFLIFVFLIEASSPGLQLLKVSDKQHLTLIASITAFIFTPIVLLNLFPIESAADAIDIVLPCSAVFYCVISFQILYSSPGASGYWKDYLIDLLIVGVPLTALFLCRDLLRDDYFLMSCAIVCVVALTAFSVLLRPFKFLRND